MTAIVLTPQQPLPASVGISIRFATTPDEIDDMLRSRYRVFVETDRYLPPNDDQRIVDRFDAYPTTRQIIAVEAGGVIGGVRFTEHTAVGLPPFEMFDFSAHTRDLRRFGSGSWYFLDDAYRGRTKLAANLLTMAYAWGMSRGWSHVLAVVNPPVAFAFRRTGWQQLGEPLHDPHKDLPFVPMMLDLTHLHPGMRALAETIIAERTVRAQDATFVFAPDAP